MVDVTAMCLVLLLQVKGWYCTIIAVYESAFDFFSYEVVWIEKVRKTSGVFENEEGFNTFYNMDHHP
jgi:hypothetical protein